MDLVGIREVSQKLGVKTSTIYAWAKKGSIPAYRLNGLWRFDLKAVDEWVRASEYHPQKLTFPKHKPARKSVDIIINNAIEAVTRKRYNSGNGKPGQAGPQEGRF